MKRLHLFIQLFLFLGSSAARSQVLDNPAGARSAGMGYCCLFSADLHGAFNNQAALATLQGVHAGASMENYFLLEELNRISVGVSCSMRKGSLFAGIDHFGDHIYSEMKAGIGYALQLGEYVDAGVKIDMLRMHIGEGYGSYNTATFEGGIIICPHPKISVGVHCFNPLQVRWQGSKESIPVYYRAGVSIHPEKTISLCAEVLKSTINKASISIGCEYSYRKKFYIRAGLRSLPSAISFGAGIKLGKIMLDIASGVNSYLGISPSISFTYSSVK